MRFTCVKTGLEAEENESASEDVEEEGEADAEGGDEYWTDRMSTSKHKENEK